MMVPFQDFRLETERLILRKLAARDIPALFATYSRPEVVRYGSEPAWTSIEKAELMVANALDGYRTGETLRVGIELKATGELIGNCNLRDFYPQNRRAETGYALAPNHWGKGYLIEAMTAFLEYGFEVLNLNRVEADIHPDNRASANSLERLGFQLEGRLRERWIVAGEVSDADYYGLLLSDWRRLHPKAGN